jgi:hypothetical protein
MDGNFRWVGLSSARFRGHGETTTTRHSAGKARNCGLRIEETATAKKSLRDFTICTVSGTEVSEANGEESEKNPVRIRVYRVVRNLLEPAGKPPERLRKPL